MSNQEQPASTQRWPPCWLSKKICLIVGHLALLPTSPISPTHQERAWAVWSPINLSFYPWMVSRCSCLHLFHRYDKYLKKSLVKSSSHRPPRQVRYEARSKRQPVAPHPQPGSRGWWMLVPSSLSHLFGLGPQPTEQCYPYFGCAFPPQLTYSRISLNSSTSMPISLSLWWFYVLSGWQSF